MDPVARAGDTHELIALARRDPRAAEQALAALPIAAQVAVVCEAPLAERGRILGLMPDPEALIPELPPAELCFTIKAIGLADAAWVLEYVTPEQTVAALDLDAWRGNEIDLATANEWLEALARTSPESRVRALEALDAELLTLTLQARIGVVQKPDEKEGWTPPESSQTVEGQFYYWALADGDDLADVTDHLRALFEAAYWSYFRLMQAVQWELGSDSEEWALRWRTGRLEDLGFPTWDEAMRIYRFLDPARGARIAPEAPAPLPSGRFPCGCRSCPRPAARAIACFARSPSRRGRAPRELLRVRRTRQPDRGGRPPAARRRRVDAHCDRKGGALRERGLAYLAAEHGLRDVELVRRVGLEQLFRVGANLDPESARP
jgi:hypothetical protein